MNDDTDLDVLARLCADPLLASWEAVQAVTLADDSDDDANDTSADCAA